MTDLESLLDTALDSVLNEGWDGEQKPTPDQRQVAAPFYPPLPMKTTEKRAETVPQVAASNSTVSAPAGFDDDDDTGDADVFNIGVLSDLAMGRTTPEQAAARFGMPTTALHDALATTLRESSAEEIAKALAIQASEQQLKSGAIYGAVLFNLLQDMAAGRMEPKEKIKFAELVAAVGKVMPKEDKNVSAGGGFTLNISMGPSEPKTIVL